MPSTASTRPYQQVIGYLNEKAGRQYKNVRSHQKLIAARIHEGYELADFQHVIDVKTAQWRGTVYEKYLRPATLFGSKFDQYLNEQTETATVTTDNEIPYFEEED